MAATLFRQSSGEIFSLRCGTMEKRLQLYGVEVLREIRNFTSIYVSWITHVRTESDANYRQTASLRHLFLFPPQGIYLEKPRNTPHPHWHHLDARAARRDATTRPSGLRPRAEADRNPFSASCASGRGDSAVDWCHKKCQHSTKTRKRRGGDAGNGKAKRTTSRPSSAG